MPRTFRIYENPEGTFSIQYLNWRGVWKHSEYGYSWGDSYKIHHSNLSEAMLALNAIEREIRFVPKVHHERTVNERENMGSG